MFCIGHTKLSIKLPEEAYLIRTCRGFLPDSVHRNLISLDQVSDEIDYYYPFLGGTAGVFAVADLIKNGMVSVNQLDRIMVFQQAKYVSPKVSSRQSKLYKSAGILYQSEADDLNISEIFSEWNRDFLFSWPAYFKGRTDKGTISENYAISHKFQDFLNFFSVAIDLGIVSPDDFIDLFNDNILIPGGACLGVFPVEFFIRHVNSLRLAALGYLDRFRPTGHSRVQRIAAAYCVERLSSHLLKMEMKKNYGANENEFFGELVMVVPDGEDYIPGSTSNFR